jgi:hypothetical protein
MADDHIRFSNEHPWIGCPQRTVPINAPWDAKEQVAAAKAFKAAHSHVPSATLGLMKFCTNYERTCKYTAYSFLPVRLLPFPGRPVVSAFAGLTGVRLACDRWPLPCSSSAPRTFTSW